MWFPSSVEKQIMEFAHNQEVRRQKCLEAFEEYKRLHYELDKSSQAASSLELILTHARRLVVEEQKAKRKAEEERDGLIRQMDMMRDLLFGDPRNQLSDETRQKIAFIHSNINKCRDTGNGQLNTINELNSTGSLLSELSYSQTDDDLDATSGPHTETMGSIADYAPSVPPFVPVLVVHCINEIEQRGMNEVGLYRVSSSERDVKMLKEKFLKGRGAPNLSKVEIPVLCSTLKDFLRSLREPLLTHLFWADFTRAVEAVDPHDVEPALCQAVADLPQPNRDTLAFLLLHLQKVSKSSECRMPIENLSKVFAPTIVGYSTAELDGATLMSETILQIKVIEQLLQLPSDYWSSFINVKTITPGKCSSQICK